LVKRLNSVLAVTLCVLAALVLVLSTLPARAQDRSSTPVGNATPAPVLDDGGWITLGNWTVQWQPSTGLLRLLPLATPTPDAPSATPTATRTPTPSATPTVTPTATPTASSTPSATPEDVPTQEVTELPTMPPSTDIPHVCEGGVAASVLNVRADHSTSAGIVGKLYIGNRAVIERMYVIEDARSEWAFVRSGTLAGWVASHYLLSDGTVERYLIWDDEDEHCYPPDMPIEWEVPPPSTPSPFDGDTLSGLHFAWYSDHTKAAQTAPLVGLAKCLTLTGSMCDTMRAANPRLVTIYRDYRSECPTREQVYTDAAGYYARLRTLWQDAPGYDYYEVQNECSGFHGQEDYAALAQFSIEVATRAAADGYCVLALSSYPGSPEISEFIQFEPYFRFADATPCGTWPNGAPKYHGLATHATGYCPASVDTSAYPWVGWVWVAGRHLLYAEALAQTRGYDMAAKRFVWIQTEWGLTYGQDEDGNAFESWELQACIRETTRVLSEQNIINGYAVWNYGKIGSWLDYTGYLPEMFQ
jgi:hypothetical protein